MDASELQTYEFQLSQVNAALSQDADNAELKNLKEELSNLIALTKDFVAQQAQASSSSSAAKAKAAPAASPSAVASSSPKGEGTEQASSGSSRVTHRFAAGDDCMARYAADGRWYPARITSVGGSSQSSVYSIVFKGYNTTELLTASDLRPAPDSGSGGAAGKKRAADGGGKPGKLTSEEELERDRKRKRNEKKTERQASKAAEAKDKQQAWQKFAKKGAKKGYNIAGAEGKSIFKTPDDPYAKVGVVGAGRGMTAYTSRQKHVYESEE